MGLGWMGSVGAAVLGWVDWAMCSVGWNEQRAGEQGRETSGDERRGHERRGRLIRERGRGRRAVVPTGQGGATVGLQEAFLENGRKDWVVEGNWQCGFEEFRTTVALLVVGAGSKGKANVVDESILGVRNVGKQSIGGELL